MAEYITKIRTDEGDKQIDYNALANLPESMKNPNAITFTNGTAGSYDGSAPMAVDIPDVNCKITERFNGFEACWVNNGVFGANDNSNSVIIEAAAGARYDISAVGKYNRFRIYGADSRESGITPDPIYVDSIAGAGAEYSKSYSFENTSNYKYIIIYLDWNTSDFYCNLSIKEIIGDINDFRINGVKLLPATAARIANVTILANKWIGTESPYSQVVTVEGATKNSQVDLTPSVEQLAIFYNKNLAFVTENEDGVVTVYAIGQKPANDYVIQATITEVSV